MKSGAFLTHVVCVLWSAAAKLVDLQADTPQEFLPDHLHLIQTSSYVLSEQTSSEQTCHLLKNEGAYFSVDLAVGTPPQHFNVVADTGSNSVIIPSCSCRDLRRGCSLMDRCFTGSNHSSTFELFTYGGNHTDMSSVPAVSITFGSGTISSVVATDVVRIDQVEAVMHNSLLLIVDRLSLAIGGPFEGILGLGQPELTPLATDFSTFLEEAKINRFSICFNDAGKPGILRLGTPVSSSALASIGKVHWGLSFNGLSIGSESSDSVLCSPSDIENPGQLTPCGMIPDTGTTLITAPRNHIQELFKQLCRKWDRCVTKSSSQPTLPEYQVFALLLEGCDDWLTEDDGQGLKEIPSIFFHLSDANDTPITLELTSWAFITETVEEDIKYFETVLDGFLPVTFGIDTGKKKRVCTPSFGVMEYPTIENGPIWILGMPLFYEFTVAFDTSHTSTSPPTISFSKEECPDSCDSSPSLLSGLGRSFLRSSSQARAPRKVYGPPRLSGIDVQRPL